MPPAIRINPSPSELAEFLARPGPFAYDVETLDRNSSDQDYNALTDRLGLLGLATENEAVIIAFLNRDGSPGPYPVSDLEDITNTVKCFLRDPSRLKVGHNAGAYDRVVLEQNLGVTPHPIADTILYHRIIAPGLRHNLGIVGSVYTDAPAWKQEHKEAKALKSDEEWARYCGNDCVVTLRAWEALEKELTDRELLAFDYRLQSFCVDLQRNGLYVDSDAVAGACERLTFEVAEHLGHIKAVAGEEFNPNSPKQLQGLLYGSWGLAPPSHTETGQPATNEDALLRLAANPATPEEYRRFITSLRAFRRSSKALVNFVQPLRHHGQGGQVLDDGRLHPSYLCHGTVTGRLSCSDPNAQTWPREFRHLIIAPPGRCIIAADMDQLELRIAVVLAGAKLYWQAFKEGADPHAITAEFLYADTWRAAEKGSPAWEQMRNFAKTFVYAVLYGAGDRKVNEIIRNTEARDGSFPYKDISLAATTLFRRNWLAGSPEIREWWKSVVSEARRDGCLVEPVLGRKRMFPVIESPSEAINFKPQAIGASLVNRAILALCDDLPAGAYPINAMHDALYVECAREQADDVVSLFNKHLNFEWNGMPFKAKAKVCRDWLGTP